VSNPPTNPAPRAAGGPLHAPSAWNVPNALTVLRLVLVPLFVWLLLREGGHTDSNRLLATAAFVVAIVTDRFDGDIARRWNLVTNFGKIADPIADKALTGAAFLGLSYLGELPWWVTIVVMVLVESVEEGPDGPLAEGRADHQGPEVDGTTRLTDGAHTVGDLVSAVVVASEGADLVAEVTP